MKTTRIGSRQGLLTALAGAALLGTALAAPQGIARDHYFSGSGGTRTPIKHLVVIFQENVSFDHYFGTYPHAKNPPGVPHFKALDDTPAVNNLLSAGLLSNNPNVAPPFRLARSEAATCSQDHDYTDEEKAADGGLMDLFVQATGRLGGVGCRDDGSTVMGYYDGNTVTALWNYAQHYAMDDNSFGTTFGPSTPGALNLVSGQTGRALVALTFADGDIATSSTALAVTGDPDPALDDCGKDKGGTVTGKGTVQMSPDDKNVGDLLNAAGITWGWFQGGFAPTSPAVVNPDGSTATPAVCGQSHTAHPGSPNPSALDGNPTGVDVHTPVSDYSAHHDPFQYYPSTRNPHHMRPASIAEIGRDGPANHQYDLSDLFAALKAHRLPAVSYVKAPAYQDGHPGYSDPVSEQTFVVDVINALQKSPEWRDTAVVINYDDTDGWYDHVPSPIVHPTAFGGGVDNAPVDANDSRIPMLPLASATTPGDPAAIPTSGVCGRAVGGADEAPRCGYGPRIPFLVISPWAKANFVDHRITDQSSSLRFIEYNWRLGYIDGPAEPPAGTASFDRIAGPILDMFDFDDAPRAAPLILDDATGEIVGHGRNR